jgi:hypothetical protein
MPLSAALLFWHDIHFAPRLDLAILALIVPISAGNDIVVVLGPATATVAHTQDMKGETHGDPPIVGSASSITNLNDRAPLSSLNLVRMGFGCMFTWTVWRLSPPPAGGEAPSWLPLASH